MVVGAGLEIYRSITASWGSGVTSPRTAVDLATYGSGSGVAIQRRPMSRVMPQHLQAARAFEETEHR